MSQVREPLHGDSHVAANGEILAWASDRESGVARHISEVKSGRACNCICPGCEHPLQAINAGKAVFKRRPHFRHDIGQERSRCRLKATQLAVRRLFLELGVFELPGRAWTKYVRGTSGRQYQGEVAAAAASVRIKSLILDDLALAILELEDGRKVEVWVRGSIHRGDPGLCPPRAVITLNLDDSTLSSLDAQQLRARLFLNPGSMGWLCHWDDEQLALQASERALELATQAVDLDPDFTGPPEWARESALHLAVKTMIEREMRMTIPHIPSRAQKDAEHSEQLFGGAPDGKVVVFTSVALERRLGRVIPDVVCSIGKHQMLLEVTVTHPVSETKLEILRELGLPVLEIDLRRQAGVVTQEELRHIVVDELHCKSWAYHPRLEAQRIANKITRSVVLSIAPSAGDMAPGESASRPIRPTVPGGQFDVAPRDYGDADAVGYLTGRALDRWLALHPERASEWEHLRTRPKGKRPASDED
jgi:hypothetical protein